MRRRRGAARRAPARRRAAPPHNRAGSPAPAAVGGRQVLGLVDQPIGRPPGDVVARPPPRTRPIALRDRP
ncbi:hypothetical protein, partial [Micromonospora saelicesensis]|uniref:hypothetical protein n=1 Tax=Micromonospora saelicesensis TaxID=285676 RepID=UPI001C66002F